MGLKIRRNKRQKTVITLPNGQHIIITIDAVTDKGSVQLGFEAPDEIKIDREEVKFGNPRLTKQRKA